MRRLPWTLLRRIVAWGAALLCVGFLVVRGFGLEAGYPWVPFLAGTPYVVVLALLAAVGALVLRVRLAALVALVAALALGGLVAPRALGGDADRGPRELRVLAVNAYVARADPDALVRLVRRTDADVLAISEANAGLLDRLGSRGLYERFPFIVNRAGPFTRGTALWSRRRLDPLPPWGNPLNPIARAVVTVGGTEVELAVVHPPPPIRSRVAQRDRELRALPPAQPDGRLRVLLGDFNATLDHAPLRDLLATGYADAAATVGAGLRPTWPATGRRVPPVTIDHVLADKRLGVRRYDVRDVPGSDHRAVVATLVVPAPR